MLRRTLLVVAADKTVRKLEVVRAEMVHPGWMRYELANTINGPGAESTVVWEQIPAGGFAELQCRLIRPLSTDTEAAPAPLHEATRAQLAQVAEPQRGTCRYCGLSIVADDRRGWIHSDGMETCGDPATCAYPVNEPAVTG